MAQRAPARNECTRSRARRRLPGSRAPAAPESCCKLFHIDSPAGGAYITGTYWRCSMRILSALLALVALLILGVPVAADTIQPDAMVIFENYPAFINYNPVFRPDITL